MKKQTTRQLILEAVLACIEQYGVAKTTTRKIAALAGTNIASINYYFSSKDDLIQKALGMALQHLLEDVEAFVADREQPFEVIFKSTLHYMIEGAAQYPGVVMAHLYPVIVEKRRDVPGAQAFRRIFELLVQRAALDYPDKDLENLRLALELVLSVMMFDMLAPAFYHQDATSAHSFVVERYVSLFTILLNCSQSPSGGLLPGGDPNRRQGEQQQPAATE